MKRTPLVRKTPLNRGTSQLRRTPMKRTAMKPWRRKDEDKMTTSVHDAIINRDRVCFIYEHFDRTHVCQDAFSNVHLPTDLLRLTVEHIKINLRSSKRGESLIETGVAMCHRGNTAVPGKTMRAAIRARLRLLYPAFWEAAHGDATGAT
jgi:hypothetical protein